MKCRYCNIALAPLRSLTDGEFCCDDHRQAFSEEQATAGTEVSLEPPLQDALFPLTVILPWESPGTLPTPINQMEAREFKPIVVKPASSGLSPWTEAAEPDPALWEQVFPLHFSISPADSETGFTEELPADLEFPGIIALPQCILDPASIPVQREFEQPEPVPVPQPPSVLASEPEAVRPEAILEEEPAVVPPYREVANSWHWLRDAWRNAPTDLKVVAILLPILLAVAVGPAMPKLKMHVAPLSKVPSLPSVRTLPSLHALPSLPVLPAGNVQQVVADRWNNLHQTILNRAAVDLTDDFRSGLDAWDSRSNLTSSWSYDASGFVQPGPLAVFKPSSDLTDYRFQFLGEIDQKGLGAAFRAPNLDNYYAVKLVVVKPGPLPLVRLVRYAVINGREERHVEKPLPLATRPDTLYRMVVDVRGSDFTIMVQGQVVDFWSDNRLQKGGVGFFCGRGEKARVRWVEVSHQYDALGRLCAYLAPYGFEGRNGNFN
jgi:hypothetical protein